MRVALAAVSLALFACGPAPPPPPLSEPAPAPPPVALPDMNLPPGPIYACASAAAREPIVLAPGVESLCRRHPEMGPCQFERDACRARYRGAARGRAKSPAA